MTTTVGDALHAITSQRGCRHCGSKTTKTSRDGTFTLQHPTVECCPAAIRDQIRYRQGDIDELRKRITSIETDVQRQREAASMYGDARSENAHLTRSRADKAESTMDAAIAHITSQIAPLGAEVRRLRTKLDQLEAAS